MDALVCSHKFIMFLIMYSFTDVNAVIFVAALSEFNEQLFEDSSVNRMSDALSLFETVCNSQYMRGISIILFLNKVYLFHFVGIIIP